MIVRGALFAAAVLLAGCVSAGDAPGVVDSTAPASEASSSPTTAASPTSGAVDLDQAPAGEGLLDRTAQELGVLVMVDAADDRTTALVFDPVSGSVAEVSDNARTPVLSPDLGTIAHVAVNPDGGDFEVTSIDGSGNRVLVDDLFPLQLAWASDGSFVVGVVRDGAGLSLVSVDVASGRVEPVTPPSPDVPFERSPTFDTRGRLAFGDRSGVAIIDFEEGGRIRHEVGVTPVGLAWAPDGAAIAFSAFDADQRIDLWLVDPDDGAVRRLTDLGIDTVGPAWSPTGSLLAFIGLESDSEEWALYVMDPEGEELSRLVDVGGPALPPVWSPDGALLAYRDGEDGEMFLIDPARAEPQPTGILGTPTAWR